MERRLAGLGFTTRRVVTPLAEKPAQRLAKWGGNPNAPAISLVAVRAGKDSAAPAVALLAHHDSVWASPGAADDIAGVAAALEVARAIPQATQARDLVLLFTDAEELGLVGARAIFAPGAAADPIAARIGVTINLEARGGRRPGDDVPDRAKERRSRPPPCCCRTGRFGQQPGCHSL